MNLNVDVDGGAANGDEAAEVVVAAADGLSRAKVGMSIMIGHPN